MPADHGTPNTGDERELERLKSECCVCEKCGHVQAEPNWCHKCRHRTTMPDWAKPLIDAFHEREQLRDELEAARSPELAEFQEGLTRALNRHGVPAMSSWDAAIDWLAEHGGWSPQGEDREAAERAGMEAGCDEAERLGYGSELGYAEAASISQKAIAAYLARVSPSRDGTVAVEDALRRIRERVMTFGGFQRTPQGEFWVARDDVLRLVDELLAEFGVSERTERIHDQAAKEGER